MGFIFDLLTLPFELLSGGFECVTTCVVLVGLLACCGLTVFALMTLNVI